MGERVDPLIGARIDRYQVERQIGAGGMGRVYLARQPDIGARVAIKVVNAVDPAEREEWTRRLFAEARAVNLIGHENIVNVLDMVRLEDGRPALVMEYLNGVSFDRLIHESGRPLPISMVTDIVTDVLSAIGAAHRAGILHRDLKPANVFVTPEGRAKVLDFGIAKAVSGQTFQRGLQTQAGKVLGTAVYMAPEQARGAEIDERADLFAVGLILYEGLTRRRAIRGPTLGEVLEQQGEPIVPASEYRAEVTGRLDAVVARALEARPEDRYKTAGAMAAALRAASTPSLTRSSRKELTAALAATGRIEINPADLKAPETPLEEAATESASTTRTTRKKTSPREDEDGGPPAAASGWSTRSVIASGLGVAAATVAVMLIMRADTSIPLELGARRVELPIDAAPAEPPRETLVSSYRRGKELAEARRVAGRILPDVELAGLSIDGAFTDQGIRVDHVRLRLYSPARVKSGERPCSVRAVAFRGELVAEADDGSCGDDQPLQPRCEAREIFAKAWLRNGESAVETVEAELRDHRWAFSIDGAELDLVDRCDEPRPRPQPRPRTRPRPGARPDEVLNPFER